LTLFVAGQETSAYSVAWSLYLMARDPQAYARARAEVDVLRGRTPSAADLGYLTRVYREALRLYPPVYLFPRFAITEVVVCPYALHRRPDLWPNPERFDPSRFEPDAEAARPRGAYLPFSDGPRGCTGQRFGMLEGPLILATLLQHADFTLASTVPVELDRLSPTLRPRGGIALRVTPLTAAGTALTMAVNAPEDHRTSHHSRP
jgi:cytochrome P450